MKAISLKMYLFTIRIYRRTITDELSSYVFKPCSIARDLGITALSNLKPGLHCTEIAYKVNARSKLILKYFPSHDPTNLTHAFIAYVRPTLVYCSPV